MCTGDVRKGIQKPHATVDRVIQALVALGLVEQDEAESRAVGAEGRKSKWTFRVTDGVDVSVLAVPKLVRSGNDSAVMPSVGAPGMTGGAGPISSHSSTVKAGAAVTIGNAANGRAPLEF